MSPVCVRNQDDEGAATSDHFMTRDNFFKFVAEALGLKPIGMILIRRVLLSWRQLELLIAKKMTPVNQGKVFK